MLPGGILEQVAFTNREQASPVVAVDKQNQMPMWRAVVMRFGDSKAEDINILSGKLRTIS